MTPLEKAKERLTKATEEFEKARFELGRARWGVEFEEMRERAKEKES